MTRATRRSTDEAVYRFEEARLRRAARVADQALARGLSWGQVLEAPAFAPFLDRVRREEAALLATDAIRTAAGYARARAVVEHHLPEPARRALAQLEDWFAFQEATSSEVAFTIGLAIGRGGAR